jgi:enamine deaminase RidA (YjgF/YER057c/UK114 family)
MVRRPERDDLWRPVGQLNRRSGRSWLFVTRLSRPPAVVACTIYLANYVQDFAAFNEAYLSVFTGDVKPSRTCVGVSALPAGTDVEITATALQRTGGPKKAISSKNAPPPAPFLSSAIGTDELVFLSGACGVKDGKFVEGTVADRTKVALSNIEALLKEEGLDLSDGASRPFATRPSRQRLIGWQLSYAPL